MNFLWYAIFVIAILLVTAAFIWVARSLQNGGGGGMRTAKNNGDLIDDAKEDVERIFNDDFREELRNRGRLHFENIINENAMFLQQDLRLTTSQLNDFMKNEITRVLKEEFEKYEESIKNARDIALESIAKTQTAIDEQRELLKSQLTEQVAAEKQQIMVSFDRHMAEIVNHYILEAVGNEIDLSDQLEYITRHLEENKRAIIDDVTSGA